MTGKKTLTVSKAAGILIILLLFASCLNQERKYVIPPKKFTAFLVDLHLAEGVGSEMKRDIYAEFRLDSASLYGSVFRKHGITQAMFDSTMFYYSRKPDKFQKLYNEVTVQLKRMEEDLAQEMKKLEEERTEVLYKSDSVYVFRQGGERIEINVPISGPGDYAVSAKVKMLADDASLDPRMSVYFENDSLPDGLVIRFQEIRYTSRNGEEKTYRAARTLETDGFTHIRGYIANFSNVDSLFTRNMVVSEIRVTKKKQEILPIQ